MKILLISLILTHINSYTSSGSAGTALFRNKRTKAACWSGGDILKLRARKLFENLIPPPVRLDELNESYIKNLIAYFRTMLSLTEQEKDPQKARLLRDCIADTIGAHLRKEILPTARFAFYAGYVPYRKVRQIHDFYGNIKKVLNTKGTGWVPPDSKPEWANLTVAKITISPGALFDPCSSLIMKRDSNACLHLPIPRFDNKANPSSLAIPFKSGGLVSLSAPTSKNILLKYYTTASRCILTVSPKHCRHADFLNFNTDVWQWMQKDVAPHLLDETLYAAFGGILRIAAAVQSYGKNIKERSIYKDSYNGYDISYIVPDKKLGFKTCVSNCCVSPLIYMFILAIIFAAVAAYFNYMLYNCWIGRRACCLKRPESSFHRTRSQSLTSDVNHLSTDYPLNERIQIINAPSQTVADHPKQVVIRSPDTDSEDEEEESTSSFETGQIDRKYKPAVRAVRSVSMDRQAKRSYSRSFLRASESSSSDYDCSSCDSYSCSTSTTKLHGRSRDVAWAKRVISKHSKSNFK